MPDSQKSEKILDALQQLLEEKSIQHISVSEIASKAGIGKGSIYYYFPSKDAIVDALIERNYAQPLQTAKNLASQTKVSSFTRMAMLFQACRNSSSAFLQQNNYSAAGSSAQSFSAPEIFELFNFRTQTGINRDYIPGNCLRRNSF